MVLGKEILTGAEDVMCLGEGGLKGLKVPRQGKVLGKGGGGRGGGVKSSSVKSKIFREEDFRLRKSFIFKNKKKKK